MQMERGERLPTVLLNVKQECDMRHVLSVTDALMCHQSFPACDRAFKAEWVVTIVMNGESFTWATFTFTFTIAVLTNANREMGTTVETPFQRTRTFSPLRNVCLRKTLGFNIPLSLMVEKWFAMWRLPKTARDGICSDQIAICDQTQNAIHFHLVSMFQQSTVIRMIQLQNCVASRSKFDNITQHLKRCNMNHLMLRARA